MLDIKIICVCRHGNVHYQIMIRMPSATTWSLSAMGVMTMAEFNSFNGGSAMRFRLSGGFLTDLCSRWWQVMVRNMSKPLARLAAEMSPKWASIFH